MRWVAVGLVLLVSGCINPMHRGGDAAPADPATSLSDLAALRLDRATATYLRQHGSESQQTTLSFEPQEVWSNAFDRVPGIVVAAVERAMSFDPETGLVLSDRTKSERFALDACATPLWTWYGDDLMDGVAVFYARGEQHPPGWREALAALQRGDLPAPASDAGDDRPAPASQRVIGHGDFLLHVGAVRGGWLVTWSTGIEPLSAPDDWSKAWRLEWPLQEPLPTVVSNTSERWERQTMSNDGANPADCFAGRDVASISWGPWGPDQDPPLPISWTELVTHVRSNPTLINTRQLLDARPDAYLFQAAVDPAHEDGLPDIPSLLGDPPTFWYFWFGAPGVTEGPIVQCRVIDGGPEQPDSFACQDLNQNWTSETPLPTVDWTSLRAHDLGPWFEFLLRYGQTPDSFLFLFDWPDALNDRPLAVLLAASSNTYASDAHYVHWDPQDPDSYVVLGFGWDEFLHPP